MKIINSILIPIIIFSITTLTAQTKKTDSLKSLLPGTDKTEKVKIINQLAEEYSHISIDSALKYSKKAIQLANSFNNKKELAIAYRNYALNTYYSGYYDKSIAYYDSSLVLFDSLKDFKARVITMVKLSNTYANANKYQQALKILFDALNISKKRDYTYGIIYTQNYIGSLYTLIRDYENAHEYLKNARKIAEESDHHELLSYNYELTGNLLIKEGSYLEALHYFKQALYFFSFYEKKKGMVNTRIDLGDYYIKIQDLQSALDNYKTALQISIENNYNRIRGTILTRISHVYQLMGELKKSLDYNYKALKARKECGCIMFTGSSYVNIGVNYFYMDKYDSAFKYYKTGMKMLRKTKSKQYIANCYYRLYQLFEKQRDFYNALNYYIKYNQTNDSLEKESKAKELSEIKAQYELQQNQNKIEIQQLKLEKKQQQLIILLTLIILVVVIFVLFYYRFRTNKKLSRQYKLLNIDLKGQYNKQSEELKDKEKQFSNLVEQVPLGVYRTTPEGKILFANRAVAKMLGYKSVDELYRLNLEEETQSDRMTRKEFKAEIGRKGEVKSLESIWTTKDGNKIIVSESSRLVTDAQGNELYYEGIVEDITNRKLAEQQLKNALQKAQESDKLKSTFLSTMQHELRTPLNSILGFAELLHDDDEIKDQNKEYLRMIYESGLNLLNIINDILDASLISTGKIKIKIQPSNINTICDELYEDFTKILEKSKDKNELKIKVSKKLDNNKASVKTDPIRVKHILSNLLNNAVKFTYKGEIEFGYKLQNGKDLLFYVKDTGIGIPKDKQEIIFDQFRQIEETDTRKYGGSGLGLSISKNLVEALGGKIWVESTNNKGSIFYFTIPYKPEEIKQDERITDRPKPEKTTLSSKKILITEDNYADFYIFQKYLKPTGVKILHATTGETAIDIVKKYKDIDLVILDIKLPDISGFQAAKKIKKIRNNIAIIAITSYSSMYDKEEAFKAGCDDYIVKPITRLQILNKAKQFLA